MTDYVVGFAFSADGERVVLIEKRRPKWQAGKLNGVGGHIEAGEDPIIAMVREYREETGVDSSSSGWRQFACLRGPDFKLHVYSSFNDDYLRVQSLTDEVVDVYRTPHQVRYHRHRLIPNLNWLLPLATDSRREGFTLYTDAVYL